MKKSLLIVSFVLLFVSEALAEGVLNEWDEANIKTIRNIWFMIKKGAYMLFTVLLLFGCQSEIGNEIKPKIKESEKRLEVTNKKIEEWETQSKVLSQKLEEANFKNENLKIRINEIDEWIGYVIKGIGPCVWAGGLFERPEPNEIVRNGSPSELISKLNQIFKRTRSPEAILLKIENETAYIKISDDDKLTQGMGTSGAANYLNSITYTLWSIKEIKCVDIDFEEGDHAFPAKDCIAMEQ